jgi:hypothetical protein
VSLFRRRCVPDLAAAIVSRSLHETAEEYAKHHLTLGALIHEATDGPVIAPFRHLLIAALARRGLMVDQVPGGWRVIRSPWPALRAVPAECTICHESWFSCEHGCGLTVAINWDDPREQKE